MDRRSSRRIMRRRRSSGGIAVVVVLVLIATIAVGVIAATTFSGNPQPTPLHTVNDGIGTSSTPDHSQQPATADPETADPATTSPELTDPATPDPASTGPEPTETPIKTVEQSSFHGTLAAQSAVLVDSDGKVLYALQDGEKRYPASTTKVLTALVALENGNLNDVIHIGNEVHQPKPGSSLAGLRYGENLSFSELLNALLIPSGNDAAYVIATYIGRKVSGDPKMDVTDAVNVFVGLMNKRAKELGATNSHFANPDGFQDEQHYTTALDMSLIAREAMTHKEFRQIVVKKKFKLPDYKVKDKDGNTITKSRMLENTNLLLDSSNANYLQNCTGIKTGHTSDAGYCLVSSAVKDGKSVFAVVMDSSEEDVWQDSTKLLQWALGLYN
jgi:serine-type D-Ala-D-Ala carboxypeptidase (penicillin-binding protein 5/6)